MRPCDLYRHGKDEQVRAALEGCNLYLVCRRHRISICPTSLRISDGLLHGDLRVHGDDLFDFERFSFSQKTALRRHDGSPLEVVETRAMNTHGFTAQVADTIYGVINIPAHVLIANSRTTLTNETDLEVLYIGQGFGRDGKRLAVDRLTAHSTLQRILAESAEENPCDEILLLMFRFEHARNIISSAGDSSVEPSASGEEESVHLKQSGNITLDRKSRINLAEAALINYFKPKYNIVHKDSFIVEKNKKLKTLKKLFSLDLSALIVEINTSNFGSKLFTRHRQASKQEDLFTAEAIGRLKSIEWCRESGISEQAAQEFIAEMTHAHIASFSLYSKTERETFLHGLPWNAD